MRRPSLVAILAALLFALSNVGSVAAYSVISENGPHGDVFLDDTLDTPAGTCNYGDVVYSNWAYFESMRVRAPQVFAADRSSTKRDHRAVSWQWKLQRKPDTATKWKAIKSSEIQRDTAYEDQQASFSPMLINYNSEKEDPDHTSNSGVSFRALVIVKWYRGDGSVEATVKLVPSLYRVNTYWAAQPSQDRCTRVNTNG